MEELNSTVVEQSIVAPEQTQVAQPTEPTTQQDPAKIFVDGIGELTPQEIKEYKQGYMRQSDYTRKSQEVARERKELEMLKQSQATVMQQPTSNEQNTNPYDGRIEQLERKLAEQELDFAITNMKKQYADFDEVKVLNFAYEKGITDLEIAYKATRDNTPSDLNSIKEQLRREIMQELQSNKQTTQTIIGNSVDTPVNNTVTLTSQQLAIAEAMGIAPEEYAKWL